MSDRLTLPRAILFDWDNTLVDNWLCIHAALNATLRAMGHAEWTIEESRLRVRASLRDSFPVMFGNRWEEAQTVFHEAFRTHHLDMLRVLDGAAALLQALHEDGVSLFVVSNKTGGYLRREADALDWTRYFKRLVGAQDASADKPNRACIDFALDGSLIEPAADVWFLGDAAIDMRCALTANCTPILVGTPPEDEDFSDARPHCHVDDLNQFFRLYSSVKERHF